jgi:adenylosuccinate synthase
VDSARAESDRYVRSHLIPKREKSFDGQNMPVTIVLGGQWGDEGKGKITDVLATSAQMVIRANGGSNAGHTVSTPAGIYKMHLVPSGILNPDCTCVIGAGVVIDPFALDQELTALRERGVDTAKLVISERAHLVLPYHVAIDRAEERSRAERAIGTTLKGIGPAYADKVSRYGIRMADFIAGGADRDVLFRAFDSGNRVLIRLYDAEPVEAVTVVDALREVAVRLRPHVAPAESLIQDAVERGEEIIIECAQGALLDVDYGTYPYVTSSSTSAAGACQGAGIAPGQISRVVGVFKAYSSRVGGGPMPTELADEIGYRIRERGHEYGTTTGRPRRVGWFDAVAARQVVRLNGVSEIALTLLDVLDEFDPLQICNSYKSTCGTVDHIPARAGEYETISPVYTQVRGWMEDSARAREAVDLPAGALQYVNVIEGLIGVPISLVGVGPTREQLVSFNGHARFHAIERVPNPT